VVRLAGAKDAKARKTAVERWAASAGAKAAADAYANSLVKILVNPLTQDLDTFKSANAAMKERWGS
jgi:hypothetical protein